MRGPLLFAACLALFSSASLKAQYHKPSRFDVTLGGGVAIGHMDVAPSDVNGAFHLSSAYNLTEYLMARLAINTFDLSAGPDRRLRAYHMSAFSKDLLGELKVLQLLKLRKKTFAYPFLTGGISYFSFTSKNIGKGDMKIASIAKSGFSLPMGLGVNLYLGKRVDVTVKYNIYMAFDDDLDGLTPTGSEHHDSYSSVLVGLRFKTLFRDQLHDEYFLRPDKKKK